MNDNAYFMNEGEECAVLQRYINDIRKDAPSGVDAEDLPTIFFIHGGSSTSKEWDGVIEHLNSHYRILAPTLPGHGQYADITHLLSLDFTSRLLASIILENSKDGKAHIVGLSLGAKVAMALITRYPSVVHTVFVSGLGAPEPSAFRSLMPRAFWTMQRVEDAVPIAAKKWLMGGTDMVHWHKSPASMELCTRMIETLTNENAPIEPWPARTLVVAAGKSGILPTNDNAEVAKRFADIGRKGNRETRAVTHPEMRHPWNQQDPELFAKAVGTWIEKGEILEGFVAL